MKIQTVTKNPFPDQTKRRKKRKLPMILVLVTPLMACAHQEIQQASEIVFCDSTASLDRFNTSIFMLSTASTASGIPLVIELTSDEREQTIYNASEMLKEVLPSWAFFGNGPQTGPQIFDSSSERSAIEKDLAICCSPSVYFPRPSKEMDMATGWKK